MDKTTYEMQKSIFTLQVIILTVISITLILHITKIESVDKFIHYVILCFWLFFTGVMDVGVQEMWR